MIIVTVYLDSANGPARSKELARMHISNIGHDPETGRSDYHVQTFRGRCKKDLDKLTLNRQGEVISVPSDDHHVWYLIGEALKAVNYDKRPGRSHKS